MFVDMLGKAIVRDIARAAKAGRRVIQKSSSLRFKRASAMTDTFVKETTQEVFPKQVQKILEKYSGWHYQGEREFVEKLYKISPEKFDIILKSDAFQSHAFPYFKDKAFLRATEKLTPKEIEETFSEISSLYKRLPQKGIGYDSVTDTIKYAAQTPDTQNIALLTILRANNKEAYNYIIKHNNPEQISSLLENLSKMDGSAFETLTIPQIRQITGEGNKFVRLMDSGEPTYIQEYVESSDLVVRNPEKVKALSKALSQGKILEDFPVFRAERDTGMFDSIILDSNMARKTKMFVLTHFGKAKKVKVHDYLGQYETFFAKQQDLLSYIMRKPQLTLADAMQVAKYGNSSYREQIAKLITDSKIPDARFKSVTFDGGFANGWNITQNGNTPIIQHMTVRKGLEGLFSPVDNRQAEFIINNSPKTMTFQHAHYDKKCDRFVLDSIIEPGIK